MNGKKLLVLYSGLAVASAASTLVVYAQLHKPRELPAFYYDVEFFEYDENGAKKYTHTDTFAVRGDGSEANVDNSLLASMGERRVTVRDYVRRESWVTSLLGRTVTTLPMVEGALPATRYEQCDEGEVGSLGGYEVRKDRRVMRNQETDELLWTFERWRAPKLGCVTLRTVRYGRGDRLTHDRVATSIVIGEPDATLFQVPKGYVESSPKQVQQKLIDLGAATPFAGDNVDIIDRAERRYLSTR